MEMSGTEATSDELNQVCEILVYWLEEYEWDHMALFHSDGPDTYVCDWCAEEAKSRRDIRHAKDCLIGQTLSVLERHGRVADRWK